MITWKCSKCREDDPCILECRLAIVNPKQCPFKLTEEKTPIWECVEE